MTVIDQQVTAATVPAATDAPSPARAVVSATREEVLASAARSRWPPPNWRC